MRRTTRSKEVGCSNCFNVHKLDERTKPEHFSGMSYVSECPLCQHDAIVTAHKAKQMQQLRAGVKN